jgi:hypothetical protein
MGGLEVLQRRYSAARAIGSSLQGLGSRGSCTGQCPSGFSVQTQSGNFPLIAHQGSRPHSQTVHSCSVLAEDYWPFWLAMTWMVFSQAQAQTQTQTQTQSREFETLNSVAVT